jgi:CheY-like chemotaxis protein
MRAKPSPAPVVLAVEDDADLRFALVRLLGAHGLRVVAVPGGDEALAYLRANPPPRLIVLDVVMGGMNGLEFRREQLRDPALAGIPVLVWTGSEELLERPEFRGTAGYLVKPADPMTLVEAARRLCAG